MSEKKPSLDALFEAAIAIESPQERATFIQQQCGDDTALRAQLEQLLAADLQAGSFLERPPAELEATVATKPSLAQRAASLQTGLAPALGQDQAVVLGSSDHSVLSMLGQTIDVPRVSLREASGEAESPIERPNSAEIPANPTLGRYRVDGEIARGGMGAILKGRDTDLGRDLAIKVLLEEHKDRPEVIQRFIEEAQIGGQLQHPGIAPVYELGQFSDQRPFFSMKLVKGQTLARLLSARKSPLDDRSRFIGIFEQVCQTLSYAHARGVIHRDLKPSNIMVGAFGEVQVMDWGLAKVLASGGVADEKQARTKHVDVSVIETRRSIGSDVPGSTGTGSSETQMGSVLGTPAYMPPEQALGEIDQLDQRADVFGLGAILCEILTGKPPYLAEDATAVFRMASRGKLDEAYERLDRCGADSELIVLAKLSLSREPEDRPSDAGAVAEQVSHYLESVEFKLRVTEQERAAEAARALEQRKRLRVTTALASVVCAVLIAGISGTTWFWLQAKYHYTLAEARAREETSQRLRANDAERLANQRLATETTATRRAEAAVEASRKSLFELNTSFGLAASEANRPAEALLWFAEAASYAEPGSLDEQACSIRHASWSEFAPRMINFVTHQGQLLRKIEFGPAGMFLASLTESNQLAVWDVHSAAGSVMGDDNTIDLAWHPENPWLVTANKDGKVRVVEIPSGTVLHETESREPVSRIAFDPEGNRIAICGTSIQLWDISTGVLTTISDTEGAVVDSISFSRDGLMVLAAYDDNFARLFATRSQTPPPLLSPIAHRGSGFPGDPFVAPIFVDQDRGILTKSGPDLVWTDISTRQPVKEFSSGGPTANSLTSSPSGTSFIVTDQGGQFQIWNAGKQEVAVQGSSGREVWGVAFTPDGQDLVMQTSKGTHRRRVVDGEQYGPSLQQPGHFQQFRVSPNGRHIAIADREGILTIWEWGTYLPHYMHNRSPEVAAVWDGRVREQTLSANGTRMKPSPSGDYFLVSGSNKIFGTMRRVTLHAAVNSAIVDNMESQSLVLDAAISRDELTLALANVDHEVFIWNRGVPESKRLLVTVEQEPLRIEFGPDATTLLVLQIDGKLSCFDTLSGSPVWEANHPAVELPPYSRQTNLGMYRQPNRYPIMIFQAYDLQPSQDGSCFATHCSNEVACVWNSKDGSLKLPPVRLAEGTIERIALSADGHWLAIAGKKSAEVWDLATGRLEQRFDLASQASALVFDSTSRRLAICVASGDCTLWDWRSHRQVCPPIRGRAGIFFGTDDQWFWSDQGLSDSGRREATLWSSVTGTPVAPSWHLSPAVELVTDIVGSRDQHVWHFNVGDLSMFIRIPIDQVLTPAEADLEQRTREAEILSSMRIVEGKAIKLSSLEWIQRVDQMRESAPEFFTSRWVPESALAWHQSQRYRSLNDRNTFAARWHTTALAKALGEQYETQASHQAEVEFFAALEQAAADELDDAARHVRAIAVEQADQFLVYPETFGLEGLWAKSEALFDQLRSAGYPEEAKRVLELMMDTFTTRFGREDQRVRHAWYVLSQLCWELGQRAQAVDYFGRLATDDSSLEYRNRLILMLLAAGRPPAAEEQLRYILDKTDLQQADTRTVMLVTLPAVTFPTPDAALADRVMEFARRFATLDFDGPASKLLLGLAQLRTGEIEAALLNLSEITLDENTPTHYRCVAYAGIAIGLANQGESDAAQAAMNSAKALVSAEAEDQTSEPVSLVVEALMLEATRLIDVQPPGRQ